MKWIAIEEEQKPEMKKLVHVRIKHLYEDAHTAVAFLDYGMTFGDGPMRQVWRSGTKRDSKGRHEELCHVTHWAPLLGPELEKP